MDGIGREGEASDPIGRGTSRLISGYDELVRVGSGGSSTVYRALDVRHQRRVAIKVLDLDASSGPRRTAFQREIEAIGRVGSHPYIVTVLGSGFTVDHHPFLVLPLFDRGTFSRLIDEQGPLTWPAAVDIGIKLCSAVETVHRAGVLHRDIKPGNVFVGVTPEHPLLADFGISSTIEGERTQTQTMAVTFGYTAPEVLDDERPTPASDIYSLAMTIFRLIQGLHAYYADTPAAVMRKILADPDRPQLSAGVPPGVAAVVADGLARDPAARPASALHMARRLQQIQVDNGLPPTPVVVADEPAIDTDRPIRPGSGSRPAPPPTTADVEAAMVEAVRQRRRSDPKPVEVAADIDLLTRPASPTRREQAEVGRILADAIIGGASPAPLAHPDEEGHRDPDPADPPPERARSTSLDLPTVVTPRRPRDDIDTDVAAEAEGNRRRWKIAVVALLLVLAGAAVAVISRSNVDELAPTSDVFTGSNP